MAWTQSDLDTIDAAIASGRGARRITFADQTIEFHSVAEMLRLRATIKREVESARTHRLAVTSKGT